MPVYNSEATVSKAVASILAQRGAGGERIELVVVDDCSTDSSLDIVKALARSDNRISIIEFSSHRGQVAAQVEGQNLCRGEFVARLDSDDIAHPDRFTYQLDMFNKNRQLGLVGSRVRYFPRRYIRDGLIRYEHWLNSLIEDNPEATGQNIERELFVECPLAQPSFMFRREALLDIGGYRDCANYPEDYDIVFRLLEGGWKLSAVNKTLHYWRDHDRRISRNSSRYSPKSFQKLKLKYLLKFHLDDGKRPVIISGAGPVGKSWARQLLKVGAEVKCFLEVNPRKIGHKIYGIPVMSMDSLENTSKEDSLILGAVGKAGGRKSIRGFLCFGGLKEGDNFIFVA